MTTAYTSTLVEPSSWPRMKPGRRKQLIRGLWAVTQVGLVAGYFDMTYWKWLVAFTVLHAGLFLGLVGLRPMSFPAQLRIAYLAWVALGTFVPSLAWMMAVTTVGIATNIIWGYCPLARMLYLLPWNREHELTPSVVWRTFISPPVPGRFRLGLG